MKSPRFRHCYTVLIILLLTCVSSTVEALHKPSSSCVLQSQRPNDVLIVSGGAAEATAIASTDHDPIIPASIAVGILTAAMGVAYGKVLGLSVESIWVTLPQKLTTVNPTYFITSVCTVGGLLVGLLSTKFGSAFTVADFVSAFSVAPAQRLPSSRIHVAPLLLLSLITSACGFSVGPEAPMVCAGALVGASLSRRVFFKNDKVDSPLAQQHQTTLAYTGAAGALTAFMGIPIAGSVFALEMTRANSGLSNAGSHAFAPAIAASVAALVLVRGLVAPGAALGGHFSYGGGVEALPGRAMMAIAIGFGLVGAVLGTVFTYLVDYTKKVAWSTPKPTTPTISWQRHVTVKTTIGLLVGLLSSKYPQTLFWGEGSLQCALDGQNTPFAATKHGLDAALTSAARVNPNLPFASAFEAGQVGLVKLVAIALACAGKFPGGIIFPLFFAAAPLAHALVSWWGLSDSLRSTAVMCLMASTQSSVTRTPLATALILSLTSTSDSPLSALLPACLVSSYLGVFFARRLSSKSYFKYS